MVVRRRGGSQDYILGGSTENSRAPLRLRSRGEPSSRGGQAGGRTCCPLTFAGAAAGTGEPARLPRLEECREKGIRARQRDRSPACPGASGCLGLPRLARVCAAEGT